MLEDVPDSLCSCPIAIEEVVSRSIAEQGSGQAVLIRIRGKPILFRAALEIEHRFESQEELECFAEDLGIRPFDLFL